MTGNYGSHRLDPTKTRKTTIRTMGAIYVVADAGATSGRTIHFMDRPLDSYLPGPHWRRLREQLITASGGAKCSGGNTVIGRVHTPAVRVQPPQPAADVNNAA